MATFMPSSSEESLSSNLPACTMAVVPRLRARGRCACTGVALLALPLVAVAISGPPRPHLHSRSLGGGGALPLRRRQRHAVVAVDRVNSAHMAMLMPQIDLSCRHDGLLGSTHSNVLPSMRFTLTKRECRKLAVLPLEGKALHSR